MQVLRLLQWVLTQMLHIKILSRLVVTLMVLGPMLLLSVKILWQNKTTRLQWVLAQMRQVFKLSALVHIQKQKVI